MADLQELRTEEIAALQAIYDSNNTSGPEALEVLETGLMLRFLSLPVELTITLSEFYPTQSPKLKVDSRGLGISRTGLFELEMRLHDVMQKHDGEMVLFNLTSETSDFASRLRGDFGQETLSDEEEEEPEELYDANDEEWVDRGGAGESAAREYMGGLTLGQIENMLPTNVGLLHAEVVLRHNLIHRFLQEQAKIQRRRSVRARSRQESDALWDEMGRTEIVFHGSPRYNIGSIVRSGFIKPGEKTVDGQEVPVRCGSTWGMGIYTSPDPAYSLSYTDYTDNSQPAGSKRRLLPGQKLIVCAVLMGRRYNISNTARGNSDVMRNYDSHVSPSQQEYVVFNPAQLLPIYVLHLDPNHRHRSLARTLRDPHFEEGKETDRQRILTARAKKFLPYGFGPSTGKHFVVLEVAPVDDDEEEWGEFQMDRRDNGVEGRLDEFQDQRHAS